MKNVYCIEQSIQLLSGKYDIFEKLRKQDGEMKKLTEGVKRMKKCDAKMEISCLKEQLNDFEWTEVGKTWKYKGYQEKKTKILCTN